MAIYKRFVIQGYRGISDVMAIEMRGLVPIIGLNECGKTTILHALMFFDRHADTMYDGIQLQNLVNLSHPKNKLGSVSAEIEFNTEELLTSFENALTTVTSALVEQLQEPLDVPIVERHRQALIAAADRPLTIRRRVDDLKYEVDLPGFDNESINDEFGREAVRYTPWLMYFDDFRMTVPNEITLDEPSRKEQWQVLFDNVFVTSSETSMYELPNLDDRIRNSTVAAAKNLLNQTLIGHWQSLRLESNQPLTLDISYIPTNSAGHPSISLSIVEKDAAGDEHYFTVADRSKGFYWFFNFVLHLEFNDRQISSTSDDQQIIFLLDEPGSYLHSAAQQRLCQKLAQLAKTSTVVYTTHSQHLLNPDHIPVNRILIAKRSKSLGITLHRLPEVASQGETQALAMQPVLAALRIPSSGFELFGKKCLIVEGMSDYYAYRLALRSASKTELDVIVYASMGAHNLKFLVPVFLAHDANFHCLWDNDRAGRKAKEEALRFFGEEMSPRFHLLPASSGESDSVLEDLLIESELIALRSLLDIPSNAGARRVISEAFFAAPADSRKALKVLEGSMRATLDVLKTLGL